MSHPLNALINKVLNRAAETGEFDNLAGAGKPLPPQQSGKDPVLDRLLKQSRAKPPAVILKENINASQARLKDLTDPEERKAEMKVLADLQMQLTMELEAYRKYG